MRIAMLAPFGLRPKGTVSARIMPLAHALAARGHLVRVVIPPWDDPDAHSLRSVSETATFTETANGHGGGVHVVSLVTYRSPASLTLTYGLLKYALRPTSRLEALHEGAAYRRALGNLTLFRPDVVHVFKPVGYSGLAGAALSALRVPWVLDVDDWEGAGGWADVNPYSPVQKLLVDVQDAALPRLSGAVTAASKTLQARTWGQGRTRRSVFYLPNGVSADKYAGWVRPAPGEIGLLKAQYGLGEGPVVLLYTRFAEFPYRWPLEIMRRVLEREPSAQLLVVGSGFFGEEGLFLADARLMGLESHVRVLGRLPEAELPRALGLADVALYPMLDNLINRAKSPVKVLEPMLLGLPIVAHRVGQAAEFIGDAGILVPPGGLVAMSTEVASLLADKGRRERLGADARERVWQHYHWERLSLVAEAAYRQALKA